MRDGSESTLLCSPSGPCPRSLTSISSDKDTFIAGDLSVQLQ